MEGPSGHVRRETKLLLFCKLKFYWIASSSEQTCASISAIILSSAGRSLLGSGECTRAQGVGRRFLDLDKVCLPLLGVVSVAEMVLLVAGHLGPFECARDSRHTHACTH
jgi:hypothetical protein